MGLFAANGFWPKIKSGSQNRMSVIPGGNVYYITGGGGGTPSNVVFTNSNATTSNVPSVIDITRYVSSTSVGPTGPNFVVESHYKNNTADMCFRIWNEADQTYFRQAWETGGGPPPSVYTLGFLNFQGSPRFETAGQANGGGAILKSTPFGWTNMYSDSNGGLFIQGTSNAGSNWSSPIAVGGGGGGAAPIVSLLCDALGVGGTSPFPIPQTSIGQIPWAFNSAGLFAQYLASGAPDPAGAWRLDFSGWSFRLDTTGVNRTAYIQFVDNITPGGPYTYSVAFGYRVQFIASSPAAPYYNMNFGNGPIFDVAAARATGMRTIDTIEIVNATDGNIILDSWTDVYGLYLPNNIQ